MSTNVIKYPAKSMINPGPAQYFFTNVFNNPTNGSFSFINTIEAGALLRALNRLRFVIYVGLNLATGAQVDDIIFTLYSPEGAIRRWSYAKMKYSPGIPITGSPFAYIHFTIKDPPFYPINLGLGFSVINPVYPSGTTSTLTIQIFREVYLA